MNYEIIRKAESFKENTEKFMNISKELFNFALKDSMSLSSLASIDVETLALIGKLNEEMNCFEAMFDDYCELLRGMTVQLDKLDKIESINTKLGELKVLDDKLDRIEEKLDKLDTRQKQSNK